jgi:hypothetical protein
MPFFFADELVLLISDPALKAPIKYRMILPEYWMTSQAHHDSALLSRRAMTSGDHHTILARTP